MAFFSDFEIAAINDTRARCRDMDLMVAHGGHCGDAKQAAGDLVKMLVGMTEALETAMTFVPSGSRENAIRRAGSAYHDGFMREAHSMSVARQRRQEPARAEIETIPLPFQ